MDIFGTDEKYEFIALQEDIATKNTIRLLYDVYYGTTPEKKLEATNIRKSLRTSLSEFKNLVREYDEAEDYDKNDLICAIRQEVGIGSPFAAFKRWLLWDNREKYNELINLCDLT